MTMKLWRWRIKQTSVCRRASSRRRSGGRWRWAAACARDCFTLTIKPSAMSPKFLLGGAEHRVTARGWVDPLTGRSLPNGNGSRLGTGLRDIRYNVPFGSSLGHRFGGAYTVSKTGWWWLGTRVSRNGVRARNTHNSSIIGLDMPNSVSRSYRRVATLKSSDDFAGYLAQLGLSLGFDREVACGEDSPFQQPYELGDCRIGNRFCVLPMEGWDGTPDGEPSDLTLRRWRHFGESGAKLIWGGEAVAVRHDGRANPNQLLLNESTMLSIEALRRELVGAHAVQFGSTSDLLVGLQLTYSGRFAQPNQKGVREPRILYHHPLLDPRVGIGPDGPCLSDADIDGIVESFVRAAVLAQAAGFAFVDIKHCHGYLGHEFLSAVSRGGKYGGSFENRTRFLREIVAGILRDAPGLLIGVRLTAYDSLPFRKGQDGCGEPEKISGPYRYSFGADPADPINNPGA